MNGIPCNGRYAPIPMSDLLPNLDALLAQLTGTTAGPRDARALAESVAEATTDADLDEALDAVIATWRQP